MSVLKQYHKAAMVVTLQAPLFPRSLRPKHIYLNLMNLIFKLKEGVHLSLRGNYIHLGCPTQQTFHVLTTNGKTECIHFDGFRA